MPRKHPIAYFLKPLGPLTQVQLAKQAGVPQPTISQLVNRRRPTVSAKNAVKILAITDPLPVPEGVHRLTFADLVFGVEKAPPGAVEVCPHCKKPHPIATAA